MFRPFRIAHFKLVLDPRQPLFLPARNKGNVLRGALGTMLRRVCCHPDCPGAAACENRAACPYAQVFEPAPPPGSAALSNFEAIPRPFVIRPPILASSRLKVQGSKLVESANTIGGSLPLNLERETLNFVLDERTRYEPGERVTFGLVLFGRAIELLPHFVRAFDLLSEEGFGVNRAPCRLEKFEEAGSYDPAPDVDGAAAAGSSAVAVCFLTPAHLVFDGRAVREPEFHHLIRRLRDRVQALATFYGDGPLHLDFKALGQRAEAVRCVARDVYWEGRERRSSRTGGRHGIGGVVGVSTYAAESPQALAGFLPLLQIGEWAHVGKHTAWGNGWISIHVPLLPSCTS